MTIYIAADHTGIVLKTALVDYIREALSYEVEDLGAYEILPEDDYPDYMIPCAKKVVAKQVEKRQKYKNKMNEALTR